MLNNASFTNKPSEVMIEKHGSEAWIWLRKDIKEAEVEDGVQYECKEAFFKTAGIVDEKEVEANFDTYFEYACSYEEETTPVSLEERISAVEDAILAMMEVE